MEIDVSVRRRHFNRVFQTLHFLVAFGFLTFGLVEFVSNPPFFDGYGDAKISQKQLPEDSFQNDPRVTDESHILRLMDLPIFLTIVAYFAVCCWLKFQGLSWLLTASMILNLVCFFIVNYWVEEMFSWKYYSSRNSGLELQVMSITLSISLIFMVIFYTRRKMPFKLKIIIASGYFILIEKTVVFIINMQKISGGSRSSLTIQPFGKVHLAWNFSVIFLVCFTCLLLWFSKLYISWACFNTQLEIMSLCEKTKMVQCHFCEECNFNAFAKCAEADYHQSFHCESPRNSSRQKAFCIFNYNVGTYTFLTVFAYVGGLCIFLATFSQILIHYIIRFLLDINTWLQKFCLRRRGRQLFVSEEIETLADGEQTFNSTELHHTATDDIHSASRLSFVIPNEDEIEEAGMGNVLLNASIG